MSERNEQAFTAEQLGERYHRSPRTIREWVLLGKMPAPALHGLWLPAQIREWEKQLINSKTQVLN